jgi:hypothetical protein
LNKAMAPIVAIVASWLWMPTIDMLQVTTRDIVFSVIATQKLSNAPPQEDNPIHDITTTGWDSSYFIKITRSDGLSLSQTSR